MVRIVSWTVCIGLCALMATAGFGCARCGESIAEKAVTKAMEQVTAADEVSIGGRGKPVDVSELPAFLKYPGATAIHKVRVSEDGAQGGHYSFETGAGVSEVSSWFETSLGSQGWKEPVKVESGELTQLHYRSPNEQENVAITVHYQDGKTVITVHYWRQAGS